MHVNTQNSEKLCVETASPYEGDTSRTFFARLLDPTSGLLHHISGLPKILHQLRLTLLKMLCSWGVPYEQPRLGDAPRPTSTYIRILTWLTANPPGVWPQNTPTQWV